MMRISKNDKQLCTKVVSFLYIEWKSQPICRWSLNFPVTYTRRNNQQQHPTLSFSLFLYHFSLSLFLSVSFFLFLSFCLFFSFTLSPFSFSLFLSLSLCLSFSLSLSLVFSFFPFLSLSFSLFFSFLSIFLYHSLSCLSQYLLILSNTLFFIYCI